MAKYASYTIRLNWKMDLDLIAIFKHPDFNFAKFLRMSIVAFVRGDDSFYIIPPERKCEVGKLDNVEVHFRLNYETESDVIAFINKVKAGQRCVFIKHVFRFYLRGFYYYPFLSEMYAQPSNSSYMRKPQNSMNHVQQVSDNIDSVIRKPISENKVPVIKESVTENRTPENFIQVNTPSMPAYTQDTVTNTQSSQIKEESPSNMHTPDAMEPKPAVPTFAERNEPIPSALQPHEEAVPPNPEESDALFNMFGSMMDI